MLPLGAVEGGGRLSFSRVVLDRLTEGSLGRTGLDGVRCEVERSREGVTVVGGEGAGRYAEGAIGFFGGAGGNRWGRISEREVKACKRKTYWIVIFSCVTQATRQIRRISPHCTQFIPNITMTLLIKLYNLHNSLRILLLVQL